jgi:hypothetical protein
MPFPPTFTNVWDTTYPPDTQLANLLGQDLRNLRTDIMQRLSLLSGTLANRPTPEIVNATWGGAGFGLLYFSTDTKQIFQWNGAAWVDVTSSIGTSIVASVNLTGQVAAIGATNFYTSVASGLHRISYDLYTTINGGAGSMSASFLYNNGAGAIVIPGVGVQGSTFDDSSRYATSVITIYLPVGNTLQYSVGYTGTHTYAFRARLEFLG